MAVPHRGPTATGLRPPATAMIWGMNEGAETGPVNSSGQA